MLFTGLGVSDLTLLLDELLLLKRINRKKEEEEVKEEEEECTNVLSCFNVILIWICERNVNSCLNMLRRVGDFDD